MYLRQGCQTEGLWTRSVYMWYSTDFCFNSYFVFCRWMQVIGTFSSVLGKLIFNIKKAFYCTNFTPEGILLERYRPKYVAHSWWFIKQHNYVHRVLWGFLLYGLSHNKTSLLPGCFSAKSQIYSESSNSSVLCAITMHHWQCKLMLWWKGNKMAWKRNVKYFNLPLRKKPGHQCIS